MWQPLFMALGCGASDLGEVLRLGSLLHSEHLPAMPGMVAKAQGIKGPALRGAERLADCTARCSLTPGPSLARVPCELRSQSRDAN